ncbi:hypothetical protein H6B11_09535 [Mediterraneibacter glycyrrhizinilyticus]|nr:DUF6465 family protein [Mediterraneibacter glycyrrhizinilyticus]MBM6854398.1 hypothetical protein [Mediterraneibacter glycyrrhizinilyticus]
MSRRTAKKRLKKINQVQASAAAAPSAEQTSPGAEAGFVTAPAAASSGAAAETPAVTGSAEVKAPAYEMFLQYQNSEFTVEEIAQRILDKCSAEGMDSTDLKIYVKPEDRKAYFACAGGNSFIDL